MLYREIMAVCSEIHTQYINPQFGQNLELVNVKQVVHIVTTVLLKKTYKVCVTFLHTIRGRHYCNRRTDRQHNISNSSTVMCWQQVS